MAVMTFKLLEKSSTFKVIENSLTVTACGRLATGPGTGGTGGTGRPAVSAVSAVSAVNYRWPVVTRIAGLLLAAGDGTRLGQPKATVELGGMTLAERGAGLLKDGGAGPVLVVTGAVPVQVPGTIPVDNPDWRSGMGSSLAAGLRALAALAADDVSGVVIALADQPLIGSVAVGRLIAAHAAGAPVAVAAYQGRPRNPVLIARGHWAAVRDSAAGDTGARPFLRAHPELVTLVECGDVGSPDDIDTPQDLARVRSQLRSPS
jgi:nicotine blue oxidoreductase